MVRGCRNIANFSQKNIYTTIAVVEHEKDKLVSYMKDQNLVNRSKLLRGIFNSQIKEDLEYIKKLHSKIPVQKNGSRIISFNLHKGIIQEIDTLIVGSTFINRTEFCRAGIRSFLRKWVNLSPNKFYSMELMDFRYIRIINTKSITICLPYDEVSFMDWIVANSIFDSRSDLARFLVMLYLQKEKCFRALILKGRKNHEINLLNITIVLRTSFIKVLDNMVNKQHLYISWSEFSRCSMNLFFKTKIFEDYINYRFSSFRNSKRKVSESKKEILGKKPQVKPGEIAIHWGDGEVKVFKTISRLLA